MSERDGYPHGVPCWVAAVEPDAAGAAAFYAALFGWETTNLMPADAAGDYYLCRLRGRDVAAVVSKHGAPPPPAPVWSTFVSVDDADAAATAAESAGGRVVGPPVESPGGGRMAVLADPAGAVLCVWQPGERSGAQLVNEPGAWAMSALHAPDVERAKEFYGALFGWETEAFGPATLWRLPGYVGGEPLQPVARDVVAVMLPHAGREPSHWSVNFWVADADAAAAASERLGGSVLEAPHDTPGFRDAVLADPQGAAFSVSALVAAG